ncbi:hypothetical protein AZ037_002480 [Klebsiella michiganensis]|nr:hypothetical protein AZ037_002480 [Klebsiella michiganensis]
MAWKSCFSNLVSDTVTLLLLIYRAEMFAFIAPRISL